MKKLVYIGNHLKSSNPTTMELHSKSLAALGFEVVNFSDKKSKLLRLLHMCFGLIAHTNANFILIDTYSTTNFYYALIVSQLARILSIPYIPILHGGNLPSRLKSNPKLCKLIFKNSFKNVAPSNYLSSEFSNAGFKTIFIPNAISLTHYKFKVRNNLQPKLLWVRAFDEIYNPEMAVRVLVELKKKYPEANLCMVGPDKDGSLKVVQQFAEKMNVLDSIEFTGYLTKQAWIKKSIEFDVFINTTNIDNTPVSVIEAMALGLPVVSTNVGGIPFLIKDEKEGLLVESNNVFQMTEKIIELLENQDRAIQIAERARCLVEGFDIELVKQQWNKLLQ